MIKKIALIAVVVLVVLAGGIGAGLLLGGRLGSDKGDVVADTPGPVVPVGEFTVNLADKDPRIARFSLTLEMTSVKATEALADPGWLTRIKNEIILTVKDRRFTALRSAEGLLELSQDLRTRLNALLPPLKGTPPVKRVLFTEFVLQ
ncbi:flagellar basal body-associated FliL family protein [Aminithiophilus ramosus]|uniref:Flagellar protein FliL n=2 Tax=Synergistales TaxID=649776 RepID=A0A9Q7EUF1_9BACT|nr:flagellar basal body-associated FliL family protein [Aminithiophilus ramosus]QTX31658.1 flagellar basal body-associated FliL family protein [Aminithiophilus ramosus]QVL35464.1 flagellar basal body-associated FliL family protein [Synergistota bacterium]